MKRQDDAMSEVIKVMEGETEMIEIEITSIRVETEMTEMTVDGTAEEVHQQVHQEGSVDSLPKKTTFTELKYRVCLLLHRGKM